MSPRARPSRVAEIGVNAKRGAQLTLVAWSLLGCSALAPEAPGPIQSPALPGLRAPATPPIGSVAATPAAPQAMLDQMQASMRKREDALLGVPLTAESAAEIALLHHPAITRTLHALAISPLDRLRLAHVPSPRLRTTPLTNTETRIERSLTTNLRSWVAAAIFEQGASPERILGRERTAHELARVVFDARRAWVDAVGVLQSVRHLENVARTAERARDDTERRAGVAQYAVLEAARAHAETLVTLARAQAAAAIARERLAQRLGLWGSDAERIQLPERLPELPSTGVGPEGLEARALAQRLDIQSARAAFEAAQPPEPDAAARAAPPVVEPAQTAALAAQLDEVAIAARAELRIAWLAYRSRFDMARYVRDVLVPLAEQQANERADISVAAPALGGSIDTVGERDDYERSAGFDGQTTMGREIVALRDFWLAEIDLQQALAGMGVAARVAQPRR